MTLMPSGPSFATLPSPSQLLELRRGGVTKVNVFRTHIALVLAPMSKDDAAPSQAAPPATATTTTSTASLPTAPAEAAFPAAAAASRGVRRRRNKRRAVAAATCIQRVARGRMVRCSPRVLAGASNVASVADGGSAEPMDCGADAAARAAPSASSTPPGLGVAGTLGPAVVAVRKRAAPSPTPSSPSVQAADAAPPGKALGKTAKRVPELTPAAQARHDERMRILHASRNPRPVPRVPQQPRDG